MKLINNLFLGLSVVFLLVTAKSHHDFKNNIHSVYKVTSANGGSGSCVAISRYQVITCAHVVLGGGVDLTMEIDNDDGKIIKLNHLHMTKIDPAEDLALMTSDEPIPYYIPCIGNIDVKVGDSVYKIGSRWGLFAHDIRTGFVSNKWQTDCDKTYRNTWQTSITVFPGDSGGGVFNADNKLVGLNAAIVMVGDPPFCRMTDIEAIIPITKIVEFLKN